MIPEDSFYALFFNGIQQHKTHSSRQIDALAKNNYTLSYIL